MFRGESRFRAGAKPRGQTETDPIYLQSYKIMMTNKTVTRYTCYSLVHALTLGSYSHV